MTATRKDRLIWSSAGLLAAGLFVTGLQGCKSMSIDPHKGGYYQCATCKGTADAPGKCCGKEMFARNYMCTSCNTYAADAGKCCGQDMKKVAKCAGCGSYCPVGEKCCGKVIGG